MLGGVTVSNGVSMGSTAYANVVGDPKLPVGRAVAGPLVQYGGVLTAGAVHVRHGSTDYPAVRGPKVRRLDLLLSRLQKLGTSTVEFRIEAQNALNTPQFGSQ